MVFYCWIAVIQVEDEINQNTFTWVNVIQMFSTMLTKKLTNKQKTCSHKVRTFKSWLTAIFLHLVLVYLVLNDSQVFFVEKYVWLLIFYVDFWWLM